MCLEDFYFSSQNTCVKCPENCTRCDEQQCLNCTKGWEINNDKCEEVYLLPEWLIVIIIMVVIALLCSICGILYPIIVGLSAHSKKKKLRQQRLVTE